MEFVYYKPASLISRYRACLESLYQIQKYLSFSCGQGRGGQEQTERIKGVDLVGKLSQRYTLVA